MVPVPPIISDDDFVYICSTIECATEERQNTLRQELRKIYFQFKHDDWSLTGTNWKGKKFPNITKQRDLLFDTEKKLDKLVGRIEDAYHVYVVEDDISFDATPDWFKPLIEKIELAKKEAERIVSGLPELIDRGTHPDLAFRRLVKNLMSTYDKYCGAPPTTNSIDHEKYATDFQYFFRACYVGFGLVPIDTFEDKVHKAVIKIRANQQ